MRHRSWSVRAMVIGLSRSSLLPRTSTSGLLCLSTNCEGKFRRQSAASSVERTVLRYLRVFCGHRAAAAFRGRCALTACRSWPLFWEYFGRASQKLVRRVRGSAVCCRVEPARLDGYFSSVLRCATVLRAAVAVKLSVCETRALFEAQTSPHLVSDEETLPAVPQHPSKAPEILAGHFLGGH